MATLQEERELVALEHRKVREAGAWYRFLRNHPEFNFQGAKDMLTARHNGEEITEATLEETANYLIARGELKPVSQAQLEQAEEKERASLLKVIVDRLKKAGVPQTTIDLEVRNKFQFQSLAELKQTIANQDLSKELRSKTVEQLKEQVRAENPPPSPNVLPAEFTREKLVVLVKSDLAAFKSLVKKFGSAQVDQRLGVVPTQRPGVSWTR